MNANELAEELHDLDVQASQQSLNDWAEQAATMLRQQQALIKQFEETQEYLYKTHDTDKAEIEALKDKLDEAEQRYWNNK